jgi:hypothetical protein
MIIANEKKENFKKFLKKYRGDHTHEYMAEWLTDGYTISGGPQTENVWNVWERGVSVPKLDTLIIIGVHSLDRCQWAEESCRILYPEIDQYIMWHSIRIHFYRWASI